MTDSPAPSRPADLRLRQGAALLAGALLMLLVLGDDGAKFFYVPLSLGLIYLAAAALGGRQGGYWATAVVLLAWGATVVFAREARPDVEIAGLYLAGVGAGALLGALLARRGFAVDPVGVAGTILAAGLILAFSGQVDAFVEARTFALLVGAVGLFNIVLGAVRRG